MFHSMLSSIANLPRFGKPWGGLLFGWFRGGPVWGGALLVLGLELGLGLMWFGDWFVLKMDTARLNEKLRRYQQRCTQ